MYIRSSLARNVPQDCLMDLHLATCSMTRSLLIEFLPLLKIKTRRTTHHEYHGAFQNRTSTLANETGMQAGSKSLTLLYLSCTRLMYISTLLAHRSCKEYNYNLALQLPNELSQFPAIDKTSTAALFVRTYSQLVHRNVEIHKQA
jgi:hypothetical protein